ncbi:hypothetical protein GOBAR_DD35006 [Gossypium barbadense]|nr:hypothetical protein GOBAR_DD35006 [Gossypium barbadense]
MGALAPALSTWIPEDDLLLKNAIEELVLLVVSIRLFFSTLACPLRVRRGQVGCAAPGRTNLTPAANACGSVCTGRRITEPALNPQVSELPSA